MNDIRRSRFGNLFIQSKLSKGRDHYLAWSSEQPSECTIDIPGEVYFTSAITEMEAIEKLKDELIQEGAVRLDGRKTVDAEKAKFWIAIVRGSAPALCIICAAVLSVLRLEGWGAFLVIAFAIALLDALFGLL